MKLLTKEIKKSLPKLYLTEKQKANAIVHAKFFTPYSYWTWYATEFDGKDIFFGLVSGYETEYGYFSLTELESVRGPFGLTIERDLYFKPKALKEISKTEDSRVYSFLRNLYPQLYGDTFNGNTAPLKDNIESVVLETNILSSFKSILNQIKI